MDGERRELGEECWRKRGVVGKGEREGREGRKEKHSYMDAASIYIPT